MNKKEFMIITEIIMSFFPKFEKKINNETRLKIWYEMFEDLNFKNAQLALKKVLVESKYMPTVSEIRQAVADIENPDNKITGSEAWGQVKKAISKYGRYREKEALESMDERVRSLTKRFGW
ncbi:MAG: replicative helicase loader/inhibitor, partial [Bacillota bacterium]